ncbi:hypothetical protein LOD99_4148 [Oopsacas minuta]|uniref:Uncharacterized protein n=1 Tax=Oopsacas minuta TaxID=111878 RepID=A0AAV7JVB8_9METZ|nr:hypothetical protein LOD99_4148 [Oopsacas minuta]
MDISLDDVISRKQRNSRNSFNSVRGRGRGRGRGSIRIGQKEYKTLTIKKSKLGGVDLSSRGKLRSDSMKPLVISSSTPGKRYFSNDNSSFLSNSTKPNSRGFKRRSLPTQSSQTGIGNRLGSWKDEESNSTQRKRELGLNRRNRGSVVRLNNTIPRVGSSGRGFKGLASNSNRGKGYTRDFLRSPSKKTELFNERTEISELSYSRGRGFRSTRGGRVGGRGRDSRSSFNKSFESEQDETNIQVTFPNPKASSSRSTRHSDYGRSNKEPSSSKRVSTSAVSDPGEHIFISVQNEKARTYVPEGVEIDPSFISHKTSTSLNERFSQSISFEGKDRIIQKHSMN